MMILGFVFILSRGIFVGPFIIYTCNVFGIVFAQSEVVLFFYYRTQQGGPPFFDAG